MKDQDLSWNEVINAYLGGDGKSEHHIIHDVVRFCHYHAVPTKRLRNAIGHATQNSHTRTRFNDDLDSMRKKIGWDRFEFDLHGKLFGFLGEYVGTRDLHVLKVAYDAFHERGANHFVWIGTLLALQNLVQIPEQTVAMAARMLIERGEVDLTIGGTPPKAQCVPATLTLVGEQLANGVFYACEVSHAVQDHETDIPNDQYTTKFHAKMEHLDGKMRVRITPNSDLREFFGSHIHIVAHVFQRINDSSGGTYELLRIGQHVIAKADVSQLAEFRWVGATVDIPLRYPCAGD